MKCLNERVVRRRLADGSVREYRYSREAKKTQRVAADSLDALIVSFQRSPEWRDLKPATQKVYRIYLRHLDAIGSYPATAVKRRNIVGLRDAVALTSGPAAANLFVRTCGALFAWGIERERIETSPAIQIKRLETGELAAWTAAEADRAVQVLPEFLRRVVLLARHTAQRRGDLIRMTWAAFDGTFIRLEQQKTGVALVIPLNAAFRQELLAWRSEAGRGLYILQAPRGGPWAGDHLAATMKQALATEGFRPEIGLHGLRKLAATELAQAGCSVHEIAAVTGHKTLAMVQHYTKAVDQQRLAEAAVVRLDTLTKRNVKRRQKSV